MWDGGIYVGAFKDDLPHGAGSFKKLGDTKSGRWNKGQF